MAPGRPIALRAVQTSDYIVSDVHLGAVPDATERAFVAFLRAEAPHMRSLLIPGDLFDFWFEWGGITVGRHFRALAAIADVVDAGVPVRMIGGNHDAWGGRFLREEVGIDFRDGPIRLPLGGREALVAHGDGVGSGDLKYRALKTVIRSRAAIAAFRVLHPELGLRLARGVSTTEGKHGGESDRGRAAYIRRWAVEQLETDPTLGLVVCGHAHLPEVHEVRAAAHYLNTGDWLHHHSYAVLRDGEPPKLLRWTGHAAGTA